MSLHTYNGLAVPSFMYGTAWKKDATTRLVKLALESGFKAIDTANQLIHYQEALVGEALKEAFQRGLNRQDLFLQTKFTSVDGQDHRTPYDALANLTTQVKQSMDSSLLHLHTDYVDSYVLHGPYSRYGLLPEDWEVWGTIEDLFNAGKTRLIGVSNVTAEQLTMLCAGARVKPMFVQNRCYAITGWDHEVREICRNSKIVYQGFSLLTANTKVLAHPVVGAIATRLGATAAQVVFRFSMQIGMLPLTGTSSAQHMKEDLEAENLQLSDVEVRQIESCLLR